MDGACTVLVVEDDPPIRALLADLLRSEGYDVAEARDGAEAIRCLDVYAPPPARLCLVFLDMMLPSVDGLGVLQHLAALNSYVPVVAMSANRDLLTAAGQAGAEDTMSKPFDVDRVLDVVERNCGG